MQNTCTTPQKAELTMLLSIVIPHYNLPREMLKRCIDSIIEQALPNGTYEIIIVDDGSEEQPLWLCNEYKNYNIKLINDNHGGPGHARNRGIEEAQGKYIQFVDADDYLFPNGDMLQCIAMLESERPQILRFGYIVKTDDRPDTIRPHKVNFSNTISGAVFMRDNNLSGSPCTYFFQRSLAIDNCIRFPEGIFHEDEEFNTLLHYHAQTLVASDAKPYCYRIREGSTTANSSSEFEKRRIDNMFTIIERVAAYRSTHTAGANIIQRAGITHKLHTLCVDVILNMMFNGMRADEIYDECESHLKPLGLFPLANADYSFKYRIFRSLANSRTGMKILRLIVPRKKPTKR